MIASLGNFHIRKVVRGQPKTRRLELGDVIRPRMYVDQRLAGSCRLFALVIGNEFSNRPLGLIVVRFFLRLAKARLAVVDGLTDDVADLFHLVDPHESIHFRHQLGQFLSVTLGQAARDNHGLAGVCIFAELSRLENGIDAFLLRSVDEGAGVDNERVGFGVFVCNLESLFQQGTHHHLGVDEVLRTAKRDHAHLQGRFLFCNINHAPHKLKIIQSQLNPAHSERDRLAKCWWDGCPQTSSNAQASPTVNWTRGNLQRNGVVAGRRMWHLFFCGYVL